MDGTRVTVTGATGLIGSAVVAALQARGASVTVLTRDEQRARRTLPGVQAVAWRMLDEPAPAEALAGADAVIHLAGEPVAQRWGARARTAIRDSRVTGTRNLVAGMKEADPRPRALVSSSAIGYYGARGEEPLDEDAPPGHGYLAQVCVDWEAEAQRAAALGLRVVLVRTGVVLDRRGGALAKMLPPFRLGVGGPVAGGDQFVSWVHTDDVVGIALAAAEDESWSGPYNATAPSPVSNRDLSRALGRVLRRPALLPVPGMALRALYGEMAQIVTTGARVMPARALVAGYRFAHTDLEEALGAALAG